MLPRRTFPRGFAIGGFRRPRSELIGGEAFLRRKTSALPITIFRGGSTSTASFEGDVTIYDQPPIRHIIPWEGGGGAATRCGPFTVNIAHLQGNARESRVPADEHARLFAKLNRFGGLYVYRDGIRILPYGNSDQDWLNIETRCNKGQAYYFFAYRRIFGAVEITGRDNPGLVEKAGARGSRQTPPTGSLQPYLRISLFNSPRISSAKKVPRPLSGRRGGVKLSALNWRGGSGKRLRLREGRHSTRARNVLHAI